MRQTGIKPDRLVDTLRCDDQQESRPFIELYDRMTPANRALVGLEAMALASKLTPRRLWELFQGALLTQSRDDVGTMIAASLTDIFRVTIKNAKKTNCIADREHLYKISGSLPTPKGATTNISVGQRQEALPEPEEESTAGDLEPADEFYLRTSKVMNPKQLPVAVAPVEAEMVEGELEGADDGE